MVRHIPAVWVWLKSFFQMTIGLGSTLDHYVHHYDGNKCTRSHDGLRVLGKFTFTLLHKLRECKSVAVLFLWKV
jgi:hypothetical protein